MTIVVNGILDRLASKGGQMYGGEAVTQLQHALQCATLARRDSAPATLVAAALLHDYGHLINEDEGAALRGVDRLHEEIAAEYLQAWFPPTVTEPIRLHVAAKRYLCAVDPGYFADLTPASVVSLAVQGGAFSAEEVAQFSAGPHSEAAIRLRIWDDTAKDLAAETPPLESFRRELEASVAAENS